MIRVLLSVSMFLLAACGESGLPQQDAPYPPEEKAVIESGVPEEMSVDAGDPADTLRAWADALEARDWERARGFWGQNGEASGMTPEEYAEAHEKYRTIEITLEEGRQEGAAGTIYYEANVIMQGELQNGDAYLMEGPVVLSRVNGVPGASSEDLEWHIETSDLRPRPVPE